MTFDLLTENVFFVCFFCFCFYCCCWFFFLSRPAPFSLFKQVRWRKLDERTSKQGSNESLKIFFVCLSVFVFLEY